MKWVFKVRWKESTKRLYSTEQINNIKAGVISMIIRMIVLQWGIIFTEIVNLSPPLTALLFNLSQAVKRYLPSRGFRCSLILCGFQYSLSITHSRTHTSTFAFSLRLNFSFSSLVCFSASLFLYLSLLHRSVIISLLFIPVNFWTSTVKSLVLCLEIFMRFLVVQYTRGLKKMFDNAESCLSAQKL